MTLKTLVKDNQYVYLYKLDNRWVIGPHALAKDNRKCWAYSSVNDGRPTEAGFKISSKKCSSKRACFVTVLPKGFILKPV